MDYISRLQWGARVPRSTRPISLPKGIAVHWSADSPRTNHGECSNHVKAIQVYHMDTKRWSDIAYSWLVCQHGYIFEGRGWGIRTAAQGTTVGNDYYHAVCWLGGTTLAPSPQALEEIGVVVREAPGTEVRPHHWFHSTACPGDTLTSWIENEGWKDEDGDMLTPEQANQLSIIYARLEAEGDEGGILRPVWGQTSHVQAVVELLRPKIETLLVRTANAETEIAALRQQVAALQAGVSGSMTVTLSGEATPKVE